MYCPGYVLDVREAARKGEPITVQALDAAIGLTAGLSAAAAQAKIDAGRKEIAANLLKGFEEAKTRSLQRAADITASSYPLPWVADYAAQSQAIMGDDFWPYGIGGNRSTLEAFSQYAWEQGIKIGRAHV